MTRILYLDEISEIAGGANSLTRLVTNLDRQRFTPVVSCPPGPLAERMRRAGIEHVPYTFRMRRLRTGRAGLTKQRYVNPLALLQKAREGVELARLARREQIDLIHTNSLSPHIAGLVAARLTRLPIVWHVRTFWPRSLYRTALPDRLIFVSEAVCRAAFPAGPPERAHVIYNGEDLSAFDPDAAHKDLRAGLGLAAGQPLVTIIGRLKPWKGHRELLAAWQIVHRRRPDARLLVVGDEVDSHSSGGSYRAELQQLARNLGLAECVIFTGFRSDIADVLHTADVYVSASRNDPNPRSVLEAMAMGKAIVGMRSGGVPEMVVDGHSALLADNGDIQGLAAAIERLLDDAPLREALGAAARRRALAKFSIGRHVAQVQALYEQMLAEQRV